MHQASVKYFARKRGKFETLTDYYKRFKTNIDILDHYGANIWYHPSLILKEYRKYGHNNVITNSISDDITLFKKYGNTVKNRAIVYAFLKGAQKDRYDNLIYDSRSQYSREVNHYPVDLNQALMLLSTHERKIKKESDTDKKPKSDEDENTTEEKEEMAFMQASKPKIPECFFCGGNHFLSTCPYRHQMKKTRIEEERNPAPTTSANILIIQDELSCKVIKSSIDDDGDSIHENTDIYDFAFTIIMIVMQ